MYLCAVKNLLDGRQKGFEMFRFCVAVKVLDQDLNVAQLSKVEVPLLLQVLDVQLELSCVFFKLCDPLGSGISCLGCRLCGSSGQIGSWGHRCHSRG